MISTLTAAVVLLSCPVAEPHREALALKVALDGDKAKVTVGFNYVGKQGDPPTFKGIRLYSYDLEAGKGPTPVGWQGKDGVQSVVLGSKTYTYFPALMDRQENGSLAVGKAADGKVRLTGVYHAYGRLFVVDQVVKPDEAILLEEDTPRENQEGIRQEGGGQANLRQQLQGEWLGGPCRGELTMNADRTFERRKYSPGNNRVTGTWEMQGETLTMTYKTTDAPDRLKLGEVIKVTLLKVDDRVLEYRWPVGGGTEKYERVKK